MSTDPYQELPALKRAKENPYVGWEMIDLQKVVSVVDSLVDERDAWAWRAGKARAELDAVVGKRKKPWWERVLDLFV